MSAGLIKQIKYSQKRHYNGNIINMGIKFSLEGDAWHSRV
jgi:hypothetical protein